MTDHLLAHVVPYLGLPATERTRFIRSARWIGYDAALAVLDTLHELAGRPPSHRTQGITLVGPYANGKTMVVDRFAGQALQRDPERQTVWVVQTAEGAGLGHFYASIVRAFGAPTKANRALEVKAAQIHELLGALKPRILVFDEFHNALRSRPRDIEAIFAFLRRLGREYDISPVLVGDLRVEHHVYAGAEMASRMTRARLPRWRLGEEYLTLLDSLESVLPLKSPSDLSEPRLATRIFDLSEGLIGEIVEIVSQAAIRAIGTGAEQITLPGVEALGYRPLSARLTPELEDLN